VSGAYFCASAAQRSSAIPAAAPEGELAHDLPSVGLVARHDLDEIRLALRLAVRVVAVPDVEREHRPLPGHLLRPVLGVVDGLGRLGTADGGEREQRGDGGQAARRRRTVRGTGHDDAPPPLAFFRRLASPCSLGHADSGEGCKVPTRDCRCRT
jgi:hypothetical protein